jgi:hypothetical protein
MFRASNPEPEMEAWDRFFHYQPTIDEIGGFNTYIFLTILMVIFVFW